MFFFFCLVCFGATVDSGLTPSSTLRDQFLWYSVGHMGCHISLTPSINTFSSFERRWGHLRGTWIILSYVGQEFSVTGLWMYCASLVMQCQAVLNRLCDARIWARVKWHKRQAPLCLDYLYSYTNSLYYTLQIIFK